MVVFRSTENINIKTTDGTLIKYEKLKNPSNFFNETVYITTYEDFENLKRVFKNVGEKYKTRVLDETKIRYLSQFPKELGISNINEHSIKQRLDFEYKKLHRISEDKEINSVYLNENRVDIEKQFFGVLKQDISLIILGSLGNSISEMICACTALRILHEKLKKKFKSVKIDIYLNASENKYYTRDKMIFVNQSFINKVSGLSIDVKEFCQYDFFIDASSVTNRSYFKNLKLVDAWLYKFGIDYKKIDDSLKYNQINLSMYKPQSNLEETLKKLKLRGKLLLFHPYSANIDKSIPKDAAAKLLKKLLIKLPDYIIVSILKLDSSMDDDRFVDLSEQSKSFLDYSYIVSNMNKIITVNTATYHIADAFFIPTIVLFTSVTKKETIASYPLSKIIYIDDKTKNLSNFIFENESLILYRFTGWKELKVSKIIKLLETF